MQGIYLTLERQADDSNKLLRIRFNRNVYSKRDAEIWWSRSKDALAQTHSLTSGGFAPRFTALKHCMQVKASNPILQHANGAV